jgi:cellulose 1,4-beta-cellobiosidase
MIWLSSGGGVQPAGTLVGQANIDGVTWDVWTARMNGWNYVAYQRRDRTRSVVDLDLKAFVDESVRRGITSSSWHLIAAEAGFEIWRGGEGLGTNSFSFRASAA